MTFNKTGTGCISPVSLPGHFVIILAQYLLVNATPEIVTDEQFRRSASRHLRNSI